MQISACDYYAEVEYTIPYSIFNAATILQRLMTQPVLLHWRLLHNETHQTGRELTLVFERSETAPVKVTGKSILGGIADGILWHNLGPQVRRIPYLFRLTLHLREIQGSASGLSMRLEEWIDAMGTAMHHGHHQAPSRIQEAGDVVRSLVYVLDAY